MASNAQQSDSTQSVSDSDGNATETSKKRRRRKSSPGKEAPSQAAEQCTAVTVTAPERTWFLGDEQLYKKHQMHSQQQQTVIRPTSIPHEKAMLLNPEVYQGLGRFSHDASSSHEVNLSRKGEELFSGERKSFVEWKPSETCGNLNTTPSGYQLSPPVFSYFGSASLRPSTGFSLGIHQEWPPPTTQYMSNAGAGPSFQSTIPGEQRQLLFLGPSDKDRPLNQRRERQRESISVVMEGRSIGGSICLHDYDGYSTFAAALKSMFPSSEGQQQQEEPVNLVNAFPGYIIAYEDSEGDLLLAGDLSWRKFVRAARRIRIVGAKGRNVVAVP